MIHIKRLMTTLGAFGGICAVVWLTGSAANAGIPIWMFYTGLAIACAVEIPCINYINKYFDGQRWTDKKRA